ncbi:RecQ family ATP-dependent DNA helicase [Virgibacillus xinjiangensis]|uniref:ATP-dependent DNA helicase RecQ n=1 Tax=Virgibacillus xinjiangensis TaxID=393090 RepID=A0ABV7CRR0_9BACI
MELEDSLKHHFGYDTFRRGQKEIIHDVLAGNDVLGILPTGSGKSICYQLPAKLMGGTTIVVSPLISLMVDQVKQLKAMRFKEVVALNSFMNPVERRNVYQQLPHYKLIYLSPELLQYKEVLDRLRKLDINLFVIDEAHCISQWGHEFRPDYLKLGDIIEELDNPPVLALSATATPQVQQDILSSLKKTGVHKHIYPMDRDNIAFCIETVKDDKEKQVYISQLLKKFRVPALIYFSSRKTAEETAKSLAGHLDGREIAFYHGGMEQSDRISIQQQFMNGQLDVICCTSAFGMGINKANIRLVIHYHMPGQIESFIQEVGRAGRDGKSSVSVLLYGENDLFLPKMIAEKELPSTEELNKAANILTNLYLSDQSLPEEEVELENLFQLTESQWRFLRYQLEKHGIIKGNQIFYEEDDFSTAFRFIDAHRRERKTLKDEKLTEMLYWVHTKDCLRKHLYKSFQPSYSEAVYHCCNNCDFSFSDWKPEVNRVEINNHTSWQDRLKTLLLAGQNETK